MLRTLTGKFAPRSCEFGLVPELWDGLWHIVVFDIPEKYKWARLALRDKLLDLGFFPYQKSVYIHPYPCRDEVDFVVEYFKMRRFVRYGILTHITNEAELLLYFNLKKPEFKQLEPQRA